MFLRRFSKFTKRLNGLDIGNGQMLKHVVDLGIPTGIFVLMLIAGTEMAVRDFVLL